MHLLQLLDDLLTGNQKASVLVIANIRDGIVEQFFGEYVHYKLETDTAVIHMNVFPPVTQNINAALSELGLTEDYFLGFDADSQQYFFVIPGKRIFDAAPTAALAVSKVLVRRKAAKKREQGRQQIAPVESGSESRVN